MIASSLGDTMHHDQESAKDDGISDYSECAEFRTDITEEIIKELEKRMKQAVAEYFHTNKKNSLKRILQRYKRILRLRLGNDDPAFIILIIAKANETRNRIRVKVRRYITDQPRHIETYFR